MDSLLELIKAAGEKANLEKGRTLELNSHVPAYGYGKNHGWSRIVRFVSKFRSIHMLYSQDRRILVRTSTPARSSKSSDGIAASITWLRTQPC